MNKIVNIYFQNKVNWAHYRYFGKYMQVKKNPWYQHLEATKDIFFSSTDIFLWKISFV